jgi:hypothetical protein
MNDGWSSLRNLPDRARLAGDASASSQNADARSSAPASGLVDRIDWQKTVALIESVAEARDRNLALMALVDSVATRFPHCTVRCGIGAARLKRFYDRRLGWLGPASELFQEAAAKWEDESVASSKDQPAEKQPALLESIRINIDDQMGLGRFVLWIEGNSLTGSDRLWLRRAIPTLRAMLWHRSGGPLTQLARRLSDSGATTRIYLSLACICIVLLAVWPVSYRVRCTTLVRPKHSRVIAAPFAATLEATDVEPGTLVQFGDRLMTLDGRPLRMELESIEAQIGQVAKDKDIAMVGGRVADGQRAELRIRELSRQRDLLLGRLGRLSVTSPIGGVIVSGDLNRSIGAPLEAGQAVMEIAPLDQMVIELEVPEYEIGYISSGAVARVRLNAADGGSIEQPINSVYPSAEIRDDQNVFIATLEVRNPDGKLRPGMRGDAIAYGPLRPWLWSLVRSGWEKSLWWIGY